MSQPLRVQLCAYSLLGLLLSSGMLTAGLALGQPLPGVSDTRPVQLTPQTLTAQLRTARVVYLGETHASPADHQAQLEIIQALYRQNPRLTLGLEMFQRPFQPVLDRYLRGELTEVELLEQSQYAQRWGFPWRLYAPILRFAKENQIPVLALNTPSEVTRKVAREGLQSLSAEERQFIPALDEIDLTNATYREKIRQVYTQIHQGKTGSTNFDRFFQAQVLWDETMAAVIVQYLRINPERQIVALAGKGHIAFAHGIPSRVARRMQVNRASLGQAGLGVGNSGRVNSAPLGFRQATILLNPEPELEQPGAADFFWRAP